MTTMSLRFRYKVINNLIDKLTCILDKKITMKQIDQIESDFDELLVNINELDAIQGFMFRHQYCYLYTNFIDMKVTLISRKR